MGNDKPKAMAEKPPKIKKAGAGSNPEEALEELDEEKRLLALEAELKKRAAELAELAK